MNQDLKEAKKLLALAASIEGKPSFLMRLARGCFDQNLLSSFKADGGQSHDFRELNGWLDNFLARDFDPVKVLRDSKIQPEVFDLLGKKLLGAKIGRQYGGLELSTLEYCLLMRTLSSHCPALGIWFTANCSIGLSGYLIVVYDALKKELNEAENPAKKKEIEDLIARTEWQMKEFLPKAAAGANAGFGLTQVTAGSDPMAMIGTDTIAECVDGGMLRVRGHKLYNTNGGIAEYEVIMAPLAPHNSICAFIVPTSGYGEFKATPCSFDGNRGMDNALIQFDVKIPESFLIGRRIGHDGFKNALRTLNVGRLAMSAGSSAAIVNCLQISRWWSKVRVQQKRPIGKYKKNALRVAKMACDAFAVEAVMKLGSMMYDEHKKDTDMRLETAAIKLWTTERAVAAARTNEKIRSGHGYETYESQVRRARLVKPHEIPIPDSSFLSDAKVLWIGEGTSDIQELIISGMIFSSHAANLLPIIDSEYPLKERLKAVFKIPYYGLWIPTRIASILKNSAIFLLTGDHYSYLKFASGKLALKSLWLMARHGPGLLKEQVATAFIANQLTELWVMTAVLWYADQLYPRHGRIVNEIAEVHCGYAISRIKGQAEDKPRPALDKKAYKLGQKIIFDNAADFLEKGVAAILDRELKRQ